MQRPEQILHRAVAAHLRQRGVPGLVWWHTANGMFAGGKRNRKGVAIQGAIMKSLGVRAGVSDIVAFHAGKFHCLELKAEGGRPTEAQLEFLADVDREGGYTAMAEGLDRALKVLEGWNLLKGVAG